jgi:hypothetical protein
MKEGEYPAMKTIIYYFTGTGAKCRNRFRWRA